MRGLHRRSTSPGFAVLATVVGLAAASLVLAGALAGAFTYTDRPSFCASCHEMRPFTQAHAVGPHASVSCIDCHVGMNERVRIMHKFSALKEVRDHFTSTVRFPLAASAMEPVPDSRCTACHKQLPTTARGFSHTLHVRGRACIACHATVGHSVSATSLASVGVLSVSGAVGLLSANPSGSAEGSADLPGHVAVGCSNCHDMAATPCEQCHKPGYKPRGACGTCHQPGPAFVFTHPVRNDCETCHTPPANHDHSGACSTCHLHRGVDWKFSHPSSSATCSSCHQPPANHNHAGACSSCHHDTGVSWAFTHPSSGATCSTCHQPPANHYGATCSSCHHKTGVSWAFTHPSSGAACSSCHQPPANHYGATCSKCHHQPGVSWAFVHPSTSMPGWRNMACVQCHPSGPPRVYCTCHNGNSPGGG